MEEEKKLEKLKANPLFREKFIFFLYHLYND